MTDITKLYESYRSCPSGISTDTRGIVPGSLFVALKGETFDANSMVKEALESGASYVVTSNTAYIHDRRAFVVDDTLTTLQDLAREHRRRLSCPIIGITGTNGKTTTKELITAVLCRKFKTYATKGNLNNHIGVPLTLLSIPIDAEIAVVEMGANHPGEIKFLASMVRPTAGLITNVGMAHIEGFGSFEGVRCAKAELYAQLRSTNSTIFIDSSNEHLTTMLGSYDKAEPYVGGRIVGHGETLTLTCTIGGVATDIATNLTGDYNLPNVLAAATVGSFYGLTPKEIAEAVADYTPTNGRSQIVQTQRNRIVLDAYNANPASMAAALDNFEKKEQPGKAVILGAMRELGGETESQHLKVLDRLMSMGIDTALLIGAEFGRHADAYPQYRFYDTTADARDDVAMLSGKYILIKGSNSNRLGSFVELL